MFSWLLSTNVHALTFGLFTIRVGLGLLLMIHGYGHLVAGSGTWQWLGGQLAHVGITFVPTFWGFLGACIEFCGGIFLVLGLGTRITAFLLLFFFMVALIFHFKSGDPFKEYSHALAFFMVLVGLFIAGGGTYSLDYLLLS